MAVIPLTVLESLTVSRICSTALIVLSFDVDSLNVTTIIVLSLFVTLFTISDGNMSIGIVSSVMSAILITSFTPSMSFILSSSFSISWFDILSTVTNEKAPIPNSSVRMSCPFIVSMSFGRYTKIS